MKKVTANETDRDKGRQRRESNFGRRRPPDLSSPVWSPEVNVPNRLVPVTISTPLGKNYRAYWCCMSQTRLSD